jgi:hypothetical protein
MNTQAKPRQIGFTFLAIILWLVSFLLGLEAIYEFSGLFYLFTRFIGTPLKVETTSPALICFLAILFLGFMILTTEYHRKRIGHPESWRLFGVTIAVELIIIILHYLFL